MHGRPRLNFFGRRLLVERLEAGWTAAAVAEAAGVSRATVYKWWRRFRLGGEGALHDLSSRPQHSPRRIDPVQEARVVELRVQRRLGPHRLAPLTGVPRSTCYKVLRRQGLHRLDWIDRPSGRVIRRYEASAPGELGHMDVKKLARIPEGGGWRVHGHNARPRTEQAKRAKIGYEFIHSLVDDYSRVAYSEVLDNEAAVSCSAFFRRALAWFSDRGVVFKAVMTDNAWAYRRGRDYHRALGEIGARALFTPKYTPRVNGKVERFNRTLLEEWAYAPQATSNGVRRQQFVDWLHTYNYHRSHTALSGRAPIERVNDLCGNYSLREHRLIASHAPITRLARRVG